jgi:hypothetical protein
MLFTPGYPFVYGVSIAYIFPLTYIPLFLSVFFSIATPW